MRITEKESGADSARFKQMMTDVKKDVAFYKKMSEVYRLAAIVFKDNMEYERRQAEYAHSLEPLLLTRKDKIQRTNTNSNALS